MNSRSKGRHPDREEGLRRPPSGGPHRRSIVLKLTLFVAALLILTAVVMNVVGFAVGRHIVRRQIHERLRVAAADRHKMILAYVAQQHERIALVKSRTRLRRLVNDFLSQRLDAATMRAGTQAILVDAAESTDGFLDIWLSDDSGQVITGTRDDYLGRDEAGKESFIEGRAGPYLGEPFLDDGRYRALLSAPVETNDGQSLGVVTVLLDLQPLAEIISDRNGLGDTGELLVATRDGSRLRYLFPPRTEHVPAWLADAPVIEQAIAGAASEQVVETRFGDIEVLAHFQPIAYQPREFRPWGLLAKIDAAEAYGPVDRFARLLVACQGLVLVLGLVLSYLLARRITRPLVSLTKAVTRLSQGDLSVRATVASQDELGALAAAFNHMAEQVQQSHSMLEERVLQRTVDLRQEIAEHERTQRQLRIARDAAEDASRAKSEFLANMSHEIRTPMNGIVGMAELLANTKLSPEQRDYLDMMRQSADALLRLLNDILDFSKIEAGKLELESLEFSLRDCVGKTAQTLSIRAASKGLELACRIAPEIPDRLVGDPGRVRQVLVNLAGNAIKFTPAGEVVIEVLPQPADNGEVTLHFSVRDTGIGIPAEKRQEIFEAFSQADTSTTRQFGGTGLGLAISSQLVALMQGRIWLESELGRGTTFHFTAKFAAGDPTREEPRELASLVGLPVLVVDDNETNRRILHEMLASWGMSAAVAPGGSQAVAELSRAAKNGRPFQLVLIDLMMPDMDGFALAQRIQGLPDLQGTPLIMISSAARPGDDQRCREAGIARSLTKPVVQSDLLNAILEVSGAGAVEKTAPGPAADQPAAAGRRLQVLLAEDGVINQHVAIGLLRPHGHQVVVAENGQQAVAAFTSGAFDVVLMDVQMPVMDGFEATAVIRQIEERRGSHTPIIAMTAAAMKGDRERCLAAGMDAYISKPVDPDELIAAIGRFTGAADVPDRAGAAAAGEGNTANMQTKE